MMREPVSHATTVAADPPVRSSKPDAERLKDLQRAMLLAPLTRDQVRELFGIAERAIRNREAISEAMGQIGPAFHDVRRGLGKIDQLLKLHDAR